MKTPLEDGDFWAELNNGQTYHYSPISDSIHRFPDPELDHVKYWDEERNTLIIQFLGARGLDALRDRGLPETKRSSITAIEFEVYVDWVVENEHEEVERLEPDDFVEQPEG